MMFIFLFSFPDISPWFCIFLLPSGQSDTELCMDLIGGVEHTSPPPQTRILYSLPQSKSYRLSCSRINKWTPYLSSCRILSLINRIGESSFEFTAKNALLSAYSLQWWRSFKYRRLQRSLVSIGEPSFEFNADTAMLSSYSPRREESWRKVFQNIFDRRDRWYILENGRFHFFKHQWS